MKTSKLANYLVQMCKGNSKSLDYCLDIVQWYTMTEKQDTEVIKEIKNLW